MKLVISTLLLLIISTNCFSQDYKFNKYVALKIEGDSTFIYKKQRRIYAGSLDTILVSSNELLGLFPDFDELQFIIKYNYQPTKKYLLDAIRCYNTYRNIDSSNTFAANYDYFILCGKEYIAKNEFFVKFHLISNIEGNYAPSSEAINENKPISIGVRSFEFNQYDSNGNLSNHGESMKFVFRYQGSPLYKKGLYFSNLDKAFGDDLEAKLYLKKFKRRAILRIGVILSGYALLGIALDSYGAGKITKFDEDYGLALIIPGLALASCTVTWSMNKMRLKFALPALQTYNNNTLKTLSH